MTKRSCELCNKPARMFCDSDEASLCFRCDEKVHAANFLVAKHSRTLLCHVCGSPTAWSAHGPKLGPTLSVCRACSCSRRGGDCADSSSRSNYTVTGGDEEDIIEDNDSYSDESDDHCDDDDDDDDSVCYDSEEDGEGENQVVPWTEGDDATWQSDREIDGSQDHSSAKRAR